MKSKVSNYIFGENLKLMLTKGSCLKPGVKSLLLSGILLLLIISCSKKVEIPKASSKFEVLVYDSRYRKLAVSNKGLVDSAFHFDNLSTVADGVTYRWDFGDGSTSTESDPQHIYKSFGTYKVSLVTTRGNDVSTPFETQILVTTGQKKISLGEATNTTAIKILETSDGNFILLGSSVSTTFGSKARPFLMTLDKNLRQTSVKLFPESFRLASIALCSDNKYIFTGTTTSNQNNNEMVMMSSTGVVLWTKVISVDANYNHIFQGMDKGYVLTGYKKLNDVNQFVSTMVKLDEAGNIVWEKVFDKESLELSFNTVEIGESYLIAGISRTYPFTCSSCDKVSVLKIGGDAKQIWRADVATNTKTNLFSPVRTTKLKNGNINVIINGSKGFYVFNPFGELVLRTDVVYENTETVETVDGSIIAAQGYNNSGYRSVATSYLQSGASRWNFTLDGTQILPQGFSCCNSNNPVGVSALKSGGSIQLSNQLSNDKNNYSVILVRLNDSGSVM